LLSEESSAAQIKIRWMIRPTTTEPPVACLFEHRIKKTNRGLIGVGDKKHIENRGLIGVGSTERKILAAATNIVILLHNKANSRSGGI